MVGGGFNLRSAAKDFEIFELWVGIASTTGMLWSRGCNGQIEGVQLHLLTSGQGVPPRTGVGDGGWLNLRSAEDLQGEIWRFLRFEWE